MKILNWSVFLQFDKDAVRQQFSSYSVFFISAKFGTGIEELLMHLREQYDSANSVIAQQTQ